MHRAQFNVASKLVYTPSEKNVIAFVRIHFQQFESQKEYYKTLL